MVELTFVLYSVVSLLVILFLVIWRWARSVKNTPVVDESSTKLLSQLQEKLPSFLVSSRRVV